MNPKSTVDEIRARFDSDVERFSNLETGQAAALDGKVMLELFADGAAVVHPGAKDLLDIGCGAGNYSLALLQRLPELNVTFMDLSRPMLDRADQRLAVATQGQRTAIQGDIRDVELPGAAFDIAVAAAVLHHLRTPDEWDAVFAKIFRSLRPGGSFWIADLVTFADPQIAEFMRSRYGDYLTELGGTEYRDKVFAYVEKEDTPASLAYQIERLAAAGFVRIDVLHARATFGVLVAFKPQSQG